MIDSPSFVKVGIFIVMDVIVTQEQFNEFCHFVFVRIIWYQIRGQMEDFHSTGTSKELSEDDMMNFNIKTIDLLTNFYNERNGIGKKDIPELSKLIINNVSEIFEKVTDKKLFMLGVKTGIVDGVNVIKQLKTPIDVLKMFGSLPPYVMGKYSEYIKRYYKK